MKIAAAQTAVSHDLSANARCIRKAISDAAAQGAGLVSFCEGALSGYAKAQIASPDDWQSFDWSGQETELQSIALLCGQLGIFAVVGGAHRVAEGGCPLNSLYVFSNNGQLLTRYDKRFLSHGELNGWYRPGAEPVLFEVDGFRFGCAICIESQFPEIFMHYEQAGADAVIFSSYGISEHFQIALRAHAGLNCLWIIASTPAQKAYEGPAGIVGPDGKWTALCAPSSVSDFVIASLDRCDPAYEVALQKARPWRARAREGAIYREQMCDDEAQGRDRTVY